jgi:hypothetical protein
MGEKKFGTAIVKYVCPICGQINEDASAIVMNTRLTKADAKKVEEMHNKVVGYSDKPCKECQKILDQDAFFVIGIDPEKSDDMKNPWRTGHLVGIKKASEFYQHLPEEYKGKNALFMDYREMRQLRMIR